MSSHASAGKWSAEGRQDNAPFELDDERVVNAAEMTPLAAVSAVGNHADALAAIAQLEASCCEREQELLLREAQFEAQEFQLVNHHENLKDEVRTAQETLQRVRRSPPL